MKKIIKTYNYFYIFFCIIWPPFQVFFLRVDTAGRTIFILSALAVFFNLNGFVRERKVFQSSAFFFWILLLCYSMFNSLYKGFSSEDGFIVFFRHRYFDPFLLLIIMMLELKKDKIACLRLIRKALFVYLILGLPFFGINDEGRIGVVVLGNMYPLHSVSLLFVSSVLFLEKEIKKSSYIMTVVFVSLIIIITGTRKAFGAEAIILLGVILNIGKKRTVGAWVKTIVLGFVLIIGINAVMNKTLLGERFTEELNTDYYVQFVDNQVINNLIMKFLGDRAVQYEAAFMLFNEHFWTGIGLTNFKELSGGDFVLHSEYMVQLCENGFIGFVLLILFYIRLFALIKYRKQKKGSARLALFGLITILFLNFTGWTYCMNYIMVIYAIIFTSIYSETITIRNIINTDDNCYSPSQGQF